MSFVIIETSIFPIVHCFQWFGYPRWITRNKSFGFIWYKIGHNVQESVSKCFNLPVGISVNVQMALAAEFAPLKCHIFLTNGRVGGILKFTLH